MFFVFPWPPSPLTSPPQPPIKFLMGGPIFSQMGRPWGGAKKFNGGGSEIEPPVAPTTKMGKPSGTPAPSAPPLPTSALTWGVFNLYFSQNFCPPPLRKHYTTISPGCVGGGEGEPVLKLCFNLDWLEFSIINTKKSHKTNTCNHTCIVKGNVI